MMKRFLPLLAAAMALPATGNAASVLLNETFTGTTAPDWTLLGSAQLTAKAGIDKTGSGWLRLTSATNNQSAFAFNGTAVPFGYGIDVTFHYSTWGGTGADGFDFVLFDGSTTPTTAGGYGGSLGYAQRSGINGLAGGILGIGFDEFGNYANPTEGRQGGIGFVPDTITIRGPGDGTDKAKAANGSTNYAYLTSTGALPAVDLVTGGQVATRPTGTAADRTAEIVADTSQIPTGHLPIQVYLTVGSGARTLVASYDAYSQVLQYYGNDPRKIPASIKFGFSGSTGGSTNNHEIQGLKVVSVQSAPGYADYVATPEPGPAGTVAIGLSLVLLGSARKRFQSK
jgi:hypothetical protein